MAKSTCSIDICDRESNGRRYCSAHQQRIKKHGDPLLHIPIQQRGKRTGTCTAPGCNREIKQRTLGLCPAHYHRVWRGDHDLAAPLAQPKAKPEPVRDFPDGTRECQGCNQRLPLDDFHNDARSPGGKRKRCKTCRIAREAERYHADVDRIRDRMSQYRRENLEKVRAADSARYERDKEKRLALAIANSHVRRARIANNGYERGITVPALRKRDGDRCYYCACKMVFKSFPKGERPATQATLEHIQPISKGGAHSWANCVLACWRCNISKGARDYTLLDSAAR